MEHYRKRRPQMLAGLRLADFSFPGSQDEASSQDSTTAVHGDHPSSQSGASFGNSTPPLVIIDENNTQEVVPDFAQEVEVQTCEEPLREDSDPAMIRHEETLPLTQTATGSRCSEMMEILIWLNNSKSKHITVGFECKLRFPLFISFAGSFGRAVFLDPVEFSRLFTVSFMADAREHFSSAKPVRDVLILNRVNVHFETCNNYPVITLASKTMKNVYVKLGQQTWNNLCDRRELIWHELECFELRRSEMDRWFSIVMYDIISRKIPHLRKSIEHDAAGFALPIITEAFMEASGYRLDLFKSKFLHHMLSSDFYGVVKEYVVQAGGE